MARLWDLPGAGTKDWPSESYVRDAGLRHFDGVLLVVAGAFSDAEEPWKISEDLGTSGRMVLHRWLSMCFRCFVWCSDNRKARQIYETQQCEDAKVCIPAHLHRGGRRICAISVEAKIESHPACVWHVCPRFCVCLWTCVDLQWDVIACLIETSLKPLGNQYDFLLSDSGISRHLRCSWDLLSVILVGYWDNSWVIVKWIWSSGSPSETTRGLQGGQGRGNMLFPGNFNPTCPSSSRLILAVSWNVWWCSVLGVHTHPQTYTATRVTMAGEPKKQGHPRTRVSQVPCYVVRNKVDQDTDPWQLIQMEVGMMMAMMDATSFLLMFVDVGWCL